MIRRPEERRSDPQALGPHGSPEVGGAGRCARRRRRRPDGPRIRACCRGGSCGARAQVRRASVPGSHRDHGVGAGKGMGVRHWVRRPVPRDSDPASPPSAAPVNSSPPARGPRSCPSARMAPRTFSPTARLPRPSGCACAVRSSGSCWRRSAWSACERSGTGRGRGRDWRGGRTR